MIAKWKAGRLPFSRRGDPERWAVFDNGAPEGEKLIAECHGPKGRENAQRIAALPDLISAARAIAEGCNHLPEQNCVHRRKLDKALAKLGQEGAGT